MQFKIQLGSQILYTSGKSETEDLNHRPFYHTARCHGGHIATFSPYSLLLPTWLPALEYRHFQCRRVGSSVQFCMTPVTNFPIIYIQVTGPN